MSVSTTLNKCKYSHKKIKNKYFVSFFALSSTQHQANGKPPSPLPKVGGAERQSNISHITSPPPPLPKGGGPKRQSDMGHITSPPPPLPKGGGPKGKVIWAILLTNMGHITDQYGPYYSPTPTPPRGRGAEGEAREGIIAPLNKVLTLEKVKTILLFARLIVPLQ